MSPVARLDPAALSRMCGAALSTSPDKWLPPEPHPDDTGVLFAHAVPQQRPGEAKAVLLLYAASRDEAQAERFGNLLPLLVRVPGFFEQTRQLNQAETDLRQMGSVFDLAILLYGETRFSAAAMRLCNELATRYGCARVSLGWMEGNNIQVRAISHTDKIEPRMDSVQHLGAAMEEAADQGIEILYPSDKDRFTVERDHKRYASEQKLTQVLTLPMPESGEEAAPATPGRDEAVLPMAGALTLERDQGTFSGQELRSLRLLCDLVTPRLRYLREGDGWMGARVLRKSRRSLGKLLGVEHTWLKLTGILLAIGLAVLIFGRKEFQVKAPFSLETDSVVYLAAPFDGFLSTADFDVGDEVQKGATVFALDTSELLLQKQAALAEITRHQSEAMRAEAAGEVSQMRIAKAQLEQARAQLDLVQFQLEQADVKAGFDAVLIEGDLSEQLNAPVEQGEVLARLARLSGLYPETKIQEIDIRYVQISAKGKVAFAARPNLAFDMVVTGIEPSARPDETGNVFTVRCQFAGDPPPWWRPGMTGVAKIDCGSRSLLWIFTRKTLDRLRLFLW